MGCGEVEDVKGGGEFWVMGFELTWDLEED